MSGLSFCLRLARPRPRHWRWRARGILIAPATSACRRPGVELKLVPNEGKLEARLRGPHITPGYWRQNHLTREAFDEEGCTGSAMR